MFMLGTYAFSPPLVRCIDWFNLTYLNIFSHETRYRIIKLSLDCPYLRVDPHLPVVIS